MLNSIGREGRAERDDRVAPVGLAVVAVVALRRSLLRLPVPSLSLLSEVEQNTESITVGVLAPPVDLDSLSPLGTFSDDVLVAPGIGVVFDVDVWVILGFRAKAGRTMLSLRLVGMSNICSAGNEKERRSRGAGSEVGARMRGGISGVNGGRPGVEMIAFRGDEANGFAKTG